MPAMLEVMRALGLVTVMVLMPASAGRAEAAPPTSSPQSTLTAPRLLDYDNSRWDYVAVGGGGGAGFCAHVHLLTYHWRNVRVTTLEVMFSGNFLEDLSFDIHVGPTIGFGGHHGPRHALSHWFVLGPWFGSMHPLNIFGPKVTYRGLFLMAGYELRVHFGRKLNWLFGLRLYVAGSPLGRNIVGPCDCDDGFLCSCDVDADDTVEHPVTFGITAFFGY